MNEARRTFYIHFLLEDVLEDFECGLVHGANGTLQLENMLFTR